MFRRVTSFSFFVSALVFLVATTTPCLKAQEQQQDQQHGTEQQHPQQPLPSNFLDHTAGGQDHTVPVNKHQVVSLLIGNLKNGHGSQVADCEKDEAVAQLQDTASKTLGSPSKATRLVRAVTEKLNATCEEIKQIAGQISQAQSHEHAEKFRRDVEDIAVSATRNPPFGNQVQQTTPQGLPAPFLFGRGRMPSLGGGVGNFPAAPGPFRFEGPGVGENPFFAVPMTEPALDMDLDRLMFICTPILGINKAFQLARNLHFLASPRSEVFGLQEKFQKNVTETEANDILQDYESRLQEKKKSGASAPASTILQNTAELSGLNATESHRFARAISQTLGPLNSTQALQIHNAIRDHGLNRTEIRSLTNDIENLNAGTTTPESATGHDWIFSGNATEGKRSVVGLESRVKMFSKERACGFAIESERGVLFPWMATLICNQVQCSGTLVSDSLVLTSASCILACGTDAVRVLLGDSRLNGCGQKVVEVLATAAVVNPNFKAGQNAQFDLALVQLQKTIDFNLNPFIYPICLLGVETDDSSIDCEGVWGNQPSQIQKSLVNCYQPGNQLCTNIGIPGTVGCVRFHNCFAFPVSTQSSIPVVCRRTTNNRYYLWGVTTSVHASNTCTSSVARISDGFSFIAQGLGF